MDDRLAAVRLHLDRAYDAISDHIVDEVGSHAPREAQIVHLHGGWTHGYDLGSCVEGVTLQVDEHVYLARPDSFCGLERREMADLVEAVACLDQVLAGWAGSLRPVRERLDGEAATVMMNQNVRDQLGCRMVVEVARQIADADGAGCADYGGSGEPPRLRPAFITKTLLAGAGQKFGRPASEHRTGKGVFALTLLQCFANTLRDSRVPAPVANIEAVLQQVLHVRRIKAGGRFERGERFGESTLCSQELAMRSLRGGEVWTGVHSFEKEAFCACDIVLRQQKPGEVDPGIGRASIGRRRPAEITLRHRHGALIPRDHAQAVQGGRTPRVSSEHAAQE